MPEWLIHYLGSLQGGVVRDLAAELRADGLGTATLAFTLGAVHALTPGHGKAALAAYFLGTEAKVWKGVRIALSASMLHVLSGFAVFLALRYVVEQAPSLTGRSSPTFLIVGYGLIVLAGAVMLFQSLRPAHVHHDGAHALTAGVGLLPCPLTISVLGFAWSQGASAMIALALLSLSLGIATTIGLVALLAIAARRMTGAALAHRLPELDVWARRLQALAAIAIITIGLRMIVTQIQ